MSHRQICSGLVANGGAPLDGFGGATVHTVNDDGFTDMVRLVISNTTAGALVVSIAIAGGVALQHSIAADTVFEAPDLPLTGDTNAVVVTGGAQGGEILVTGSFVRDGA